MLSPPEKSVCRKLAWVIVASVSLAIGRPSQRSGDEVGCRLCEMLNLEGPFFEKEGTDDDRETCADLVAVVVHISKIDCDL